jgi:hypothetical protein
MAPLFGRRLIHFVNPGSLELDQRVLRSPAARKALQLIRLASRWTGSQQHLPDFAALRSVHRVAAPMPREHPAKTMQYERGGAESSLDGERAAEG